MITVVGSLNYDLVTYTKKVPEAGETYQAHAFETHLGGKGLNEALACARLSTAPVRMVGNVGSDSFGKELTQALKEANVDVNHVRTVPGSSGVAVIMVEDDGENRILITPGANGQLKPTDHDLERVFKNDSGYVVLQNEFPATLQTIDWLHLNRPNISICYNPSPFRALTPETLRKIDLLIVNQGEALEVASALGLETHTEHLAQSLQKKVNQKKEAAVVITLGGDGSIFADKNGSFSQAASKVEKVVDTTGAGDTFFGGIVAHLSEKQTLQKAVEFASRASALAIQKKGAAESIPKRAELA